MKEILKSIIFDQKSLSWKDQYIRRDFPEKLIRIPDIVVVSGVRRCGKSTLLYQLRSVHTEPDYYLNFDDERLVGFRLEHFQLLLETFSTLFGEKKTFWFDEIQNVPGWERFVRRLHDYGNKVFITGSNATMLSRELGTHLTGRYVRYELFPFSFMEFLSLKNGSSYLVDSYSTKGKARLIEMFNEYFVTGGFPQYVQYKDDYYLQALFESIVYRDVMTRNRITAEKELKELVFLLSSNISKPYSTKKLASAVGVQNATTVKSYIGFLCDSYLFYSLNRFDFSAKKQMNHSRKIFAIDHGLVRKLGFHFSEEQGRILENLVFIELMRRGKEVYYYKEGRECDFLIRENHQVVEAIQVCYFLESDMVREREINGLLHAMQAFGLKKGIILTGDHLETVSLKEGEIQMIPVYQWLIEYV